MARTGGLFGAPREWARDLAIATGIGAFLGVIGPFGSFNGGSLELRLFYWIANLWIGFVLLSIIVRLSLRAGTRLDLPVWFALPVGVAIGALPLGATVAVFSALAWPPNHGRIADFLAWYGQTLAISEPCAFGYFYLTGNRDRYSAMYDQGRRAAREAGSSAAAETVPAPEALAKSTYSPFLGRLPTRLGRDVLCLQMEDHYVRVHTLKGSDLVLIPLKQAVAELSAVEGLQVHRSWWVARAATTGAINEGRNLKLRLSNGMEVPVARAAIARLRASGWLEA
jgi:DNA-binding LytR/AlgR family response regulator